MGKFKLYSMIVGILLIIAMIAGPVFFEVGRISAGYEGVKVNNLGSGKSAITTMDVGYYVLPMKYSVYEFPLYLQTEEWVTPDNPQIGAFSFQSNSGLVFQGDFGLAFKVNKGYSGEIFAKYRKDLDDIAAVDVKNRFQDALNRAASTRIDEEIYGEGKQEFLDEVRQLLQADLGDAFSVEKVSLKSRLVLPPSVVKGIDAKVKAEQDAQKRRNEIATAEAQRKIDQQETDAITYDIREKAKAEAEAIEMVQEQIAKSPQYVEYLKATKWNGELPSVTGGAIPMLNVGGAN